MRKRSPAQTRRGAEGYERIWRNELVADDEAGRDPFAEPPPNFAEFAERWLREYVLAMNRPSTHVEKESYLRNHLTPTFGHLQLNEITTRRIDEFAASRRRLGLQPKSVNNMLTTLRCCLVTARDWRLLRDVPRVRWLRVPEQPYAFLSGDDVNRLLAATRPGIWRVLVTFLLDTGCRFGEAAGLRWEELELRSSTPTARICRAAARGIVGTTKTGRVRVIPLTSRVARELREFRHDREYVFSAPDGRIMRPEISKHTLHRLCRRAGIRHVGWHALRHTFATRLTGMGVSLRAVQELLGHTTIVMTCRYAHATPGLLRDSVALLENPRQRDVASRFGHQVVTNPEGATVPAFA